jgi:hypothetical protein
MAGIFYLPSSSTAYSQADYNNFQRSIGDYRSRLNPKYQTGMTCRPAPNLSLVTVDHTGSTKTVLATESPALNTKTQKPSISCHQRNCSPAMK